MSTLTGAPFGQTEVGSAYTEAALLTCSEAHAPARLLGVAQVAIETALGLNSVAEIHTHLAEALGRIKPEVTA